MRKLPKPVVYAIVALISIAVAVVCVVGASEATERDAVSIFGITLPKGYRDWRLISVAREEGGLNDIEGALRW